MKKNFSLIFASLLVVSSFIFNHLYGYTLAVIILMVVSTLFAGWPIFKRAFGALKFKIVGIEALVTIATTGALIIGEYWEAAAVTYLFMLGSFLEAKTIEKTRHSIRALLDLVPDTGRVIRDGKEVVVNFDEIEKGEKVVIKPGERIAVDGFVLEGNAFVNQATVTGESIPVEKSIGSEVYSATVLESGYLIVEATKVKGETTFDRILELVEEAQDNKATTQKFLEKFSRYYTPAIIVLSASLFLITRNINLSLTLLVIACPGALVISTPVSIVAGIGNGAKKGLLFKGGEAIEQLGTIRAIAFDKTGTVTEGKPVVVNLRSYGPTEQELLHIAASGETYSEHPIAKAIVQRAEEDKSIEVVKPAHSEPIVGKGVAFSLDEKNYIIGNRALFLEHNINLAVIEKDLIEDESKGYTVVIVGTTDKVIGLISVADTIRSEAESLVSDLKKVGIRQAIMLTGDNPLTAKTISEKLHFDDYKAALLPEDKVDYIKELSNRYKKVAMVGDGVNDAPALATADLGIAIGSIGSDVAMESADIVIMSDKLNYLSYAIALSRATVRNMKQNIIFALLVAAFLLMGVLIQKVDLALGMLVHELSVLLVIINAIRLLNFGKKKRLS
ncbi:MAG: heavy metal translocating P-type ATPase [Sphaerochaetaceae bacterium]